MSSFNSVPFRTFSKAEQMVQNCVIIKICPISSTSKGKTDGTELCHLLNLYQPADFRMKKFKAEVLFVSRHGVICRVTEGFKSKNTMIFTDEESGNDIL